MLFEWVSIVIINHTHSLAYLGIKGMGRYRIFGVNSKQGYNALSGLGWRYEGGIIDRCGEAHRSYT
jgi:hypothetical protein